MKIRSKLNLKELTKSRSFLKKFCAGGTALIVLAASVTWGATAGKSLAADEETAAETQETIEKTYPELLASASTDGKSSKEETVYVIADADGKVTSTTASEWLRNGKGEAEITDVTTLKDIENTANDSTYTESGNNIIWQANGSDIKYKGTVSGNLPVSVSISYYLDGQKMSASDIAGKAGNVEIRFNYSVNETTSAGGYGFVTPYTMASGVLLSDEHFTNVEVTNGKAVDDGSNCVCLGIAFPGMKRNLDISSDTLDIPESVTIKAYTDCFELEGSYTVALTGLLSNIDLDDTDSVTDKLEQLEDALDKLESASKKLVSGSSDLYEGTEDLLDGATTLYNGANTLYSGLQTISSNSDDLDDGALKVFNTLLSTANTQLAAAGLTVDTLTVKNYQKVLTAVINSLDTDQVYASALAQVTAAVEAKRSDVEAAVTAAVKETVTAQVTAAVQEQVTTQVTAAVQEQVLAGVLKTIPALKDMTVEQYKAAVEAGKIDEETQTKINAAVEAQMAATEIQTKIENTVSEKMASDEIKATISQKVEEQMASDSVKALIAQKTEAQIQQLIADNMASDEVQAKLKAAAEGAQSVIALKTSLDSYNAFYLGILAYTAGVDKATSGAGNLADGAKKLKSGASKLSDGAYTLYDGMKTFNNDGIEKLTSKLDDADIDGLLDRIEALADASKQTKLVGGIAEGMEGSSKIIIKTGAVKAQ